MSVSITPESKNSYSLSNENKESDLTWDEATMTWDEATRTWELPGRPMTRESKNANSLSNETK
jgi:hypothetical protein